MIHYHTNADEMFVVVSGQIQSTMITPTNVPISHNLTAGDILVYPKGKLTPNATEIHLTMRPVVTAGWLHLQFNPTCRPADTFLAFNAAKIGTTNVVSALAAAPAAYLAAAFDLKSATEPNVLTGEHPDLWARDAACLKSCRR